MFVTIDKNTCDERQLKIATKNRNNFHGSFSEDFPCSLILVAYYSSKNAKEIATMNCTISITGYSTN